MIKEIINFVKNPENLHLLILILPPFTFYLTNQKKLLLIFSIIVSTILFVYRIDLKNKVDLFIKSRINTKRKRKKQFRSLKEQIKNVDREFWYIFSWKFFMIVNLIFLGLLIYSTFLSYNYKLGLFLLHLASWVFVIFLYLIINYNLNLLHKREEK